MAPGSLPWMFQTGYAQGASYSVRVQVVPAVQTSGTVTSVFPDRLIDAGATFLATAQENDFAHNTTTQQSTIIDSVVNDTTLALGGHIFATAGDAYSIYDRQMIGATIIVRYADGTEDRYSDARDAGVVDFTVSVP
jgi:hypothetical protein